METHKISCIVNMNRVKIWKHKRLAQQSSSTWVGLKTEIEVIFHGHSTIHTKNCRLAGGGARGAVDKFLFQMQKRLILGTLVRTTKEVKRTNGVVSQPWVVLGIHTERFCGAETLRRFRIWGLICPDYQKSRVTRPNWFPHYRFGSITRDPGPRGTREIRVHIRNLHKTSGHVWGFQVEMDICGMSYRA